MEKSIAPDIEEQIARLLNRKKKDYLTVAQIRNGLSAVLLKQLGLIKNKSLATDVLKCLRPYLGSNIDTYKGARCTYIGFNMSLKDIILDKIRRNPGISSKNLARNLPMLKKEFISSLNKLLEAGTVICTFNENHTPCLRIPNKVGTQMMLEERPVNGRIAFKAAYDKVGRGQNIVRIHRIREHLNWPGERFDLMLVSLMADYTIELHGGDPSMMSEKEIRDSFTDENGVLYINLTWWGKNDDE